MRGYLTIRVSARFRALFVGQYDSEGMYVTPHRAWYATGRINPRYPVPALYSGYSNPQCWDWRRKFDVMYPPKK